MAKKKRKRQRRPVAPPLHSAPGAVHSPSGPSQAEPPPSRPLTPEPPPTAAEPVHSSAPARRTAPRRTAAARRRRNRWRNYAIALGVVVLIAGIFVGRQTFNNRRISNLNAIATSAGCSELRETGTSGGAEHLREGETTTYDTSPPTHGKHAPNALNAGVYSEPFTNVLGDRPTIYQAVHSLEHGYVIVWHDELGDDDRGALERRYRNERKVIVVPYPQLQRGTTMALTAWGRMMECERPSIRVIDAFVDVFREASSAPEPKSP